MVELVDIKQSDVETLLDNAEKDDHIVFCPTHVIKKDDNLIGYASIGGIITVHWWLDTEKGTAMDTLRIMKTWEDNLREQGITHYQMLCSDSSPYLSKMKKLGYSFVGKSNLFIKEL